MSQTEETPLAVASRRLIEKRKSLRNQLQIVDDHMHGIAALKEELETGLENAVGEVDLTFSHLAKTLDATKSKLIHRLEETVSMCNSTLAEYERQCSNAAEKAKEALDRSSELLSHEDQQWVFFRSYSSTSQSLEEGFMDLLLLPHSQPTTEVSLYIAKLKEVKLNVAQLQESIESLKLPSDIAQMPFRTTSTKESVLVGVKNVRLLETEVASDAESTSACMDLAESKLEANALVNGMAQAGSLTSQTFGEVQGDVMDEHPNNTECPATEIAQTKHVTATSSKLVAATLDKQDRACVAATVSSASLQEENVSSCEVLTPAESLIEHLPQVREGKTVNIEPSDKVANPAETHIDLPSNTGAPRVNVPFSAVKVSKPAGSHFEHLPSLIAPRTSVPFSILEDQETESENSEVSESHSENLPSVTEALKMDATFSAHQNPTSEEETAEASNKVTKPAESHIEHLPLVTDQRMMVPLSGHQDLETESENSEVSESAESHSEHLPSVAEALKMDASFSAHQNPTSEEETTEASNKVTKPAASHIEHLPLVTDQRMMVPLSGHQDLETESENSEVSESAESHSEHLPSVAEALKVDAPFSAHQNLTSEEETTEASNKVTKPAESHIEHLPLVTDQRMMVPLSGHQDLETESENSEVSESAESHSEHLPSVTEALRMDTPFSARENQKSEKENIEPSSKVADAFIEHLPLVSHDQRMGVSFRGHHDQETASDKVSEITMSHSELLPSVAGMDSPFSAHQSQKSNVQPSGKVSKPAESHIEYLSTVTGAERMDLPFRHQDQITESENMEDVSEPAELAVTGAERVDIPFSHQDQITESENMEDVSESADLAVTGAETVDIPFSHQDQATERENSDEVLNSAEPHIEHLPSIMEALKMGTPFRAHENQKSAKENIEPSNKAAESHAEHLPLIADAQRMKAPFRDQETESKVSELMESQYSHSEHLPSAAEALRMDASFSAHQSQRLEEKNIQPGNKASKPAESQIDHLPSAHHNLNADQPKVLPTLDILKTCTHASLPAPTAHTPQLLYLKFTSGSRLTTLVTEVTSPASFCAQPYGPELVHLMEEMCSHYDSVYKQEDEGGLSSPPAVGDFCCAQFTEDNCWYRAKVTAVNQLYTTEGASPIMSSDTWVKVEYVDYGNQEQLPLTHLQPLDPQFCMLPCQALYCSLANIQPGVHPLGDTHGLGMPGSLHNWPPNTCEWLSKLLLGQTIEMVVVHSRDGNEVAVDICLPPDILFSPECLAKFPIPVQSVANISQYRHSPSAIDLASFMLSIGIAKVSGGQFALPLQSLSPSQHPPQARSSTPWLHQTLPVSAINEQVASACFTITYPSEVTSLKTSLSSGVTTYTSAFKTSRVASEIYPDKEAASSTLSTTGFHEEPSSVASILSLSMDSLNPLPVQLGHSNDFDVLVSHVVSPSQFFVHPIQQQSVDKMLTFPESLRSHYSDNVNCYPLPTEHLIAGNLCCIHLSEEDLWCRGIITSVNRKAQECCNAESQNHVCRVFLVDYGEALQVHATNIYALDKKFCKSPVLCVCCALNEIQPLVAQRGGEGAPSSPTRVSISGEDAASNSGIKLLSPKPLCTSTETAPIVNELGCSLTVTQEDLQNHSLISWPSETLEYMRKLTDGKQLVAVVRKEDVSDDSMLHLISWNHVLPVELYDTNGEKDIHINSALVHAGLAKFSIVLQDNMHMESTSEATGKGSPIHRDTQLSLKSWNPMESDFLAERNIYKIDDEDANLALQGYKSTKRLCRYFNTPAGCRRGSVCPFLHLQDGVSDQQMKETPTYDPGKRPLPSVGDWVVVMVTAVVSATHFYIQLPLGAESLLSLRDSSSEAESESDAPTDINGVVEEMTNFYNHQVFQDRDVIVPAWGEIISARNSLDDQWYRAKVLNVKEETVQVFYVDFGNTDWIRSSDVRSIRPDFMQLPFQAVECCLAGVELAKSYADSIVKREEAREKFEQVVKDKLLTAQVIWRGWNNILGVELHDSSGVLEENISEELIITGVLSPVKAPLKQEELLGIPKQEKRVTQILLPG